MGETHHLVGDDPAGFFEPTRPRRALDLPPKDSSIIGAAAAAALVWFPAFRTCAMDCGRSFLRFLAYASEGVKREDEGVTLDCFAGVGDDPREELDVLDNFRSRSFLLLSLVPWSLGVLPAVPGRDSGIEVRLAAEKVTDTGLEKGDDPEDEFE